MVVSLFPCGFLIQDILNIWHIWLYYHDVNTENIRVNYMLAISHQWTYRKCFQGTCYTYIHLGMLPHPVAVTSRIMIFIQGIPMNLSFPLLLGGRSHPKIYLYSIFSYLQIQCVPSTTTWGFSHVPSISSATSPWRGEFPTFLAARKILVSSGRRFGSLDLRPQGKPLSVMRLGSFTTLGGPFFVL